MDNTLWVPTLLNASTYTSYEFEMNGLAWKMGEKRTSKVLVISHRKSTSLTKALSMAWKITFYRISSKKTSWPRASPEYKRLISNRTGEHRSKYEN